MSNKKPVIKYLHNGEYHYATVKDIGDLSLLASAVKTDLVSAINSIVLGGIDLPPDLLDQISNLKDSVENGGLNSLQMSQLIDEVNERVQEVKNNVEDALDAININVADLKVEYNETVENIQEKINEANGILTTTKDNLDNLRADLGQSDLNISAIERSVNALGLEIIDKVSKTEFELTEAVVQRHETEIKQNAEEISQRVSQEELSLATNRISDVESLVEQSAEEIKSKVTAQEMREEIEKIEKYNPNLLKNTRDWEDYWIEENDVTISTQTYRNCHILILEKNNVGFKQIVENLEIGRTYTVSVWAKSDNPNAKLFVETDAETIQMEQSDGDMTVSNDFVRYKAPFVASETEDSIKFIFTDMSASKGYLAAAKLETGVNMSGWQDHADDNYARIKFNETEIKQTKDSIQQTVTAIERIDGDLTSKETRLKQTEDGFEALAERVTETEGDASYAKSYIEQNADKIASSVSSLEVKDIANASIEDAYVSNRNLILNSDFSREWEDWTNYGNGFILSSVDGQSMAKITRTGLSADVVVTLTTNYFPVKDKDRIMFGFDFWSENIGSVDGANIIASIELYDASNVRVDFKNIAKPTSYLNGSITRVNETFVVDRQDVAKARLIFRLSRNGSVAFSHVVAQLGSIRATDWTPAPEDAKAIQVKNDTKFEQTDTEIGLRATKVEVEQLSGDLISYADSKFEIASDKISSSVTEVKQYTDATVDGIEIGGRNLAHSENIDYRYGTLTSNSTKNISGNGRWFIDIQAGFLPNTTYTISNKKVINEGSNGETLKVLIYNDVINSLVQSIGSFSSGGARTFTTSSNVKETDRMFIYISNGTTSGNFEIHEFKLEKGNKATDWQPAPEDHTSFTQASIETAIEGINLQYVRNDEITAKLNLSEEGVKIDGRLLEIDTHTKFNGNLTMNAGVIRGKDNGIIIDLNQGTMTLNKPLTIGTGSNVASKDDLNNIEIGGRNLVLNSSELEASGLDAVSGSRSEYRTINTGESYMDLEDGEVITISFDIEMKIAKANPKLQVCNSNVPGPVGIPPVVVDNQLQGAVGETINKRISFTTYAQRRSTPSYSYNTLEFYSVYDTNNFFRISKLKVERGNIATDWTEAPEDTQAKLDEKADVDLIDNIQDQLDDFVLIEGYEAEIGEINQALQDYKELIEAGGVSTDEAVKDIKALLDRTVIIENNLGEFTESWNFDVTEITMGEEGLFLGDSLTSMGIRIAPQVGSTPPRIDFVDNGTVVAVITGQYMRINRGIFVQSATIGEHKIETIAGGHTIWSWIPS